MVAEKAVLAPGRRRVQFSATSAFFQIRHSMSIMFYPFFPFPPRKIIRDLIGMAIREKTFALQSAAAGPKLCASRKIRAKSRGQPPATPCRGCYPRARQTRFAPPGGLFRANRRAPCSRSRRDAANPGRFARVRAAAFFQPCAKPVPARRGRCRGIAGTPPLAPARLLRHPDP